MAIRNLTNNQKLFLNYIRTQPFPSAHVAFLLGMTYSKVQHSFVRMEARGLVRRRGVKLGNEIWWEITEYGLTTLEANG